MKRSLLLGGFVACAVGSVNAGALDSVPSMYGSETLKNLTLAVLDQCTAMGQYPADNDQIGCLVQLNPCSMGYAGGGAVSNNPGTVPALVNGVARTSSNVQALLSGGPAYPLARKLYVNSIRGFETLLNSSDPNAPTGKDAELDLVKCFANLPFSTASSFGTAINVASASFGFVPLPAPVGGGNAKAICEDFWDGQCSGASGNADACKANPTNLPSSACNNGYKDGDETGVDVCPAARPTCTAGVCQ